MKNYPYNYRKLSITWLIAGVFLLIAIIYSYQFTVFSALGLNLTRTEAEEIASKFLIDQGFNIDGYSKETDISAFTSTQQYFLQELKSEDFKKSQAEYIPNQGWAIFFHQNLAPQVPQILYRVTLNNAGKILLFSRTIPDTSYHPSLSKDEAEAAIKTFIRENTSLNINSFEMIENREDRFSKRTDHTFRWEKLSESPAGKYTVMGKTQGDQVGQFIYSFEIPPDKAALDNSSDTLIGSISIIFVFLLTQLAIFLFLKKYHQGEVWVSMGRNFFLVFMIFSIIYLINAWPSVGSDIQFGVDVLTTKVITFLGTLFLVYLVLALLLFASWTVGESYCREIWPQKLRGIDAFLKGKILTLDSGISLLRGLIISLGIILFYFVLSIVVNNSNDKLLIYPTNLLSVFNSFIPIVDIFSDSFRMGLLTTTSITFLIITISYEKWKSKYLSIFLSGLVFLAGIIMIEFSPSVNNIVLTVIIAFLFGCFYAYLFFRYDLLTILSIQYHISLVLGAITLYASGTDFYKLNFILLLIALLATPVMYVLSQIRKETFELENFGTPEHVKRISERERLKKELEIASKVQLSLLPKEHPKLEGYDIYGMSIPAKEAGGDYYDFVTLEGKNLGIAIGDVSGKGIGAAIYMTLTKGILQAHAEENTSPAKVLSKVNKLLFKTIEKNAFVSMFYSILDYENNILHYSRAGHNPGIFSSFTDKTTKLLKSKGMALGLEEGSIFTNTLVEDEIKLNSGDLIVLYTDGFTEAMNSKLEEFGEPRFLEAIKKNEDKSAKELTEKILSEVNKFVEGYPQHDDMTIVVLKCKDIRKG